MLDNYIRLLRKKVRHLCKDANYFYVQKNFAEYRKRLDLCYQVFEMLDKYQRLRFEQIGSYLPASNGKVMVYIATDDLWLGF